MVLVVPVSLAAQDKASSGVTATGCLQKGVEAGGYFLTDASGKTYELSASKADLAGNVGHQITVTGQAVHHTKSKEIKLADYEKKESNGGSYEDVKVTSLTVVSKTCK
jgi:hypothetical protein